MEPGPGEHDLFSGGAVMMTEEFPIKVWDKTWFKLIKKWSSNLYFWFFLGIGIFLMTLNLLDRGTNIIGSMKTIEFHMV